MIFLRKHQTLFESKVPVNSKVQYCTVPYCTVLYLTLLRCHGVKIAIYLFTCVFNTEKRQAETWDLPWVILVLIQKFNEAYGQIQTERISPSHLLRPIATSHAHLLSISVRTSPHQTSHLAEVQVIKDPASKDLPALQTSSTHLHSSSTSI